MNCDLRQFGNDVIQLSYRHASICANFSFNLLKKIVRDQRWPTAPLFVVKKSPPFREYTAPLRHILPIYNFTINSNNLFVNFRWTFTYCVEKSYDGTHLAFGGTLDLRTRHETYVTVYLKIWIQKFIEILHIIRQHSVLPLGRPTS